MSKKPTKGGPKKVAAVSRQSPGTLAEHAEKARSLASRGSGELEVSTLVRDLGSMIEAARKQVAVAANAALTTLYWQMGRRVRTEVLDGRRAEYGAQMVAAVGRQLEAHYGRGVGEKNLRRMVQFATVFPDPEIVATLSRQLGSRGIHVAEYLTELPPREVLEDRLHRAIEAARNRLVLGAGVDVDAAPLAPTSTTPGSKPKRKGRRK